ncbi:MAG: LuxR C-terminal-related transcriptional regulator [Microvirga sp.]
MTGASGKQTLAFIAGLQLGSTPLWRDAVEGSLRIAVFTQVRLLGEAIALSLAARDAQMEVVLARNLEELRGLTAEHPALELVIVDTTQSVDLEAIRAFHRDHPELPLLALGLREGEAEIVAHGSAGFACYLRREDGLDRLCAIVEDAMLGRLNCSPEIAAAIMRGLFRNGPVPIPQPAAALTRREDEVAQLVSRALSNKEIARELRLSESTVKHHVHSILGKFGLSTRGQLMRDMRRDAWAQEGPARSHA